MAAIATCSNNSSNARTVWLSKIQFGAMPPVIVMSHAVGTVVPERLMESLSARATPAPQLKPIVTDRFSAEKETMRVEEEQRQRVFSTLEKKLSSTNRGVDKYHKVILDKRGVSKIVPIGWRKMREVKRAEKYHIEKTAAGPWGPSVLPYSVCGGPLPSSEPEELATKWPLNKVPSRKVRKVQPSAVKLNQKAINDLIIFVTKTLKTRRGLLQITTNRTNVVTFPRKNGKPYACIQLKHMKGWRVMSDVRVDQSTSEILETVASKTQGWRAHRTSQVQRGWSGFILRRSSLAGKISRSPDSSFIVRGLHEDKLYDARVKITRTMLSKIIHYSSVGEKFWKGFDNTFLNARINNREHECSTNLDVQECGSVAALMCLALFPCGKITCLKCVDDNINEEGQASSTQLVDRVRMAQASIRNKYPQFKHALAILDRYEKALTNVNQNYSAFSEIQSITDGRNNAAFAHVNKLNAILIKGASASSVEFITATNHLLEIARYMKNRTENIEKGSLSSFRNKISQKAHVNPTLMCDNQLDKNGNFVWGERGYHAKRFFNNYFEVIKPEDGYSKYEIRTTPNGTRKLAIGKLIVSTNFAILREQMQGESIEVQPLTKECVSMMNGDYVHACCCVTNESGEPLLSDIRMPTKHHLVIGNSGDPKYVDLPDTSGGNMYIARDGYCYINIFLAMLVNVNESDAKAFTKMVRDVLVDKLGKWPSLLDVATACYLLKVFFPDVSNAELPRILVDHKTKTMHVIDSYGSISTGYHILKANTVEQLIKFTRHSLESDMKHYLVGGDPLNEEVTEEELVDPQYHLKLLIESIYKPRMFVKHLIWNRYLPLYAMLSPGVLLALYNSGSLETLMDTYLQKDNDLVLLLAMIESLAQKVSQARSVLQQIQIIERSAPQALEMLTGIKQRHVIPYNTALKMITVIAARAETNQDLNDAGYDQLRDTSVGIMEKKYLQMLQEEWRELHLSEKLSAIYRSSKFAMLTRKHLHPGKETDLGGRYSESIIAYFGQARQAVRNKRVAVAQFGRHMIDTTKSSLVRNICSLFNYMIPSIMRYVNVLLVISLLLTITREFQVIVNSFRKLRIENTALVTEKNEWQLAFHHTLLTAKLKESPTLEEFKAYLEENAASLLPLLNVDEQVVMHQAKRQSEQALEQIIAFVALVLMMVDPERSDCVTKILSKLKNLVTTVDQDVYHQSLDEISDDLNEKNLTIDFEINQDDQLVPMNPTEMTFGTWWAHQISKGYTIPHYRTEGHYMVFTRDTAVQVANEIAHNQHQDILLMGAVGSGKSTGLPFHLSKKGSVLMIEPTRPLAENVHRQLAKEPFYMNTTLKMRGLSTFGSAPITIMTSGFALNYLAHNRHQISDFKFIVFDECHVHDANAMTLRCLLHENEFGGKILKVSATPPGREVEFKTQYPVTIATEESVSFQNFVAAQGSKSNCDTLKHGDNILVYVASYNEVDILSSLLNDKGYKVTKVDGRSMKVGSVEIVTSGTPQRPHFIVATNIIENGVTLDIEVVVDFGTKVVPVLDSDSRLMSSRKVAVSYGERIQRLGRVGRHKPGHALRIGHTERGLTEVPSSIATEAAFRCFTYGLPVIPNNVTTSILANATVRQARTMAQFELTPFYIVHFVRFDGTMHHAIHNILKRFKLRDSEIALSKLAIPNKGLKSWMTCSEYARIGANIEPDDNVRVPFMCKEVPEKLHFEIWDAIIHHKADAGFGRLTSASACKIAYTLQTDVTSIQRTIRIIDTLIMEERKKQEYFRTVTANTVSSSNFSLQSIANAIRSRFSVDHTTENISILECAKAQLCEFQNLSIDKSFTQMNSAVAQGFIREFGALETVYHQSTHEVSEVLQLKGRWNKTLITRDVIVLASVFAGGAWMLYRQFMDSMQNNVYHESKSKRQRQKLKFRNARDSKMGREVYGDDGDIEHYFGAAYTEKGKKSGKTRGMGTKQRKFVNMYAFDPEDFSAVRFVDPLTGATMDESPYTDVQLIQEYFGKIRDHQINEDELDYDLVRHRPGIKAYYMNKKTGKALKVDLTPHNPLKVCDKHVTIAGFPERGGELRQTGQPEPIPISEIPSENEVSIPVKHESASLFKGLRDYNPIASCVCKLTNISDGHKNSIFGVGYGPLILTNRHLFERNNGEMVIKTHHGEFTVRNTTQLNLYPIPDRDLILIRLPKDVPPFPQRFQFRQPVKSERICLVGSNFQTKSITSLVSESSMTLPVNGSNFWKHWITTKDGQCGTPIVATSDGAILGLHSLTNFAHSINYFSGFPDDFKAKYLDTYENHEWVKHWKYNTSQISWGVLNIKEAQPSGLFKTSKLVLDLNENSVYSQMERSTWLYDQLNGNLKAIAYCPSQLVTKHTVKGKCQLFDLYLKLHEDAADYFTPFLGQYQKSRLNREAYAKDLLKYSTPIEVGEVDYNCFERVNEHVKQELVEIGFQTCNFVTDESDIFAALNMKSAVGALYTGKKKDFFADFTPEMKEQILRESCWRLFSGQMGVWNGSLKAELRPLEKVNANKTRTFTAAPIDTLLAGKVCVDDFNNQFYDFNLQAPWSVGMTKFYGGWNKLLNALPDGWVHCDADGSQFDSSLTPYLINAILGIRLYFMEDWELGHQMLRNLYTEIVYTPISTPDGTLVKKFKGNNSGQPSTVVDNTLMVMMAVRYSLLKSGVPLELQNQMCKFFVNGDDLLISVNPNYEYVLDDMQSNFRQLGLKYTFDSRTRNKEDLWFMSHKGIKREDIWIPKLEEERIVSILEWDRSKEPCHRLEAICAAMIESWGYERLTHEIRKFYAWVLEQAPYSAFAAEGTAPYIAESALRKLYLDKEPDNGEIMRYLDAIFEEFDDFDVDQNEVYHQSSSTEVDAGREISKKQTREMPVAGAQQGDQEKPESSRGKEAAVRDRDVNAGTSGTFSVPRLKGLASKMNLPKYKGKSALNLDHLLDYNPNQVDISNTRATQAQFHTWYEGVREDYELSDDKMQIILNGLMVWCIENGTSPNINGMWVMMDGDEQVEFPIKPLIDHAKPTFRQIMAHFSNVAEAYIEKRNQDRPYMPRYGLQRNLTDMSLARYAFDFYEMTSKTPVRAREAHIQMKAAALRSAKNNLFGLDGNVGTTEENTERHTTEDVNQKMHSLLGMKGM